MAKNAANDTGGGRTAAAGDRTLRTYAVGAMPIVSRLLQRMKLEEFFAKHLRPNPWHLGMLRTTAKRQAKI